MNKKPLILWATCAAIAVFIIWRSVGHPPIWPSGNMGFDNTWDCPPNATPASTVCIKKK